MLNSQCVLMNIESEVDEETFEWTARSVQFGKSHCILFLIFAVSESRLRSPYKYISSKKLAKQQKPYRPAVKRGFSPLIAILLVNCFAGTTSTSEQLSKLCSIRKHNT